MHHNLSPEQAITKFEQLLRPHQVSLTFNDHFSKVSFSVLPNNGSPKLVCNDVTASMLLRERRLEEAAFELHSHIEKAGRHPGSQGGS